jgi:prepilin-type N-terminal cleavage/methylation domain-containing protein
VVVVFTAHRRAFTLTEVTTVLVLFATLAAIGSLTFASFFTVATDTAAEGRLDAAHATQLRFATTWGRFTPHVADLSAGAGVVIVAGPASEQQVSIAVGDSGSLVVATATAEGCVARRYPPVGEGYAPTDVTLSGTCDAVDALGEDDLPQRDPELSARW